MAGRITGAQSPPEGTIYKVFFNDWPNHLHGGREGFNKNVWAATPLDRSDKMPFLRLEYRSPSGEEAYPGTVHVAVTYILTDDNVARTESDFTTDKSTPFNLTRRSYFNLAGEGAISVVDHELAIFADHFVPVDRYYTNLRRLKPLDGRTDFRTPRVLRDITPAIFQQHGALYRPGTSGADAPSLKPAARVFHPTSGRAISVSTTEPYMQFYTGSGLDGSLRGKSGNTYGRHSGMCLECQGYPDGINVPRLGNILLHPGHVHHGCTAYAFSVVGIG